MNTSLAIQILPYSLVFVYWPGFSSPRVLVSRRRPHYLSFFTIVNSMLWFKYCPQHAAHGLVPLSANPAFVTIHGSETHKVAVLAATFTVHRSSTQRLPPALPPLLRRLYLFFITPAKICVSHGRWHSNFVWHPDSVCRAQHTVLFQSLPRKFVSLPYSRTATGHLSSSAFSVVPVANVLACRHSLPPATPRAGSSSLLTSLSRITRGILQHIVRLGQLYALLDPTPPLASLCFSWLLSIAAHRLPKSPCHMRHMEQTRRVAVDNLVSSASLAAYPRTG
jgi:hypothetical protein